MRQSAQFTAGVVHGAQNSGRIYEVITTQGPTPGEAAAQVKG